jgi:CheY-like chemotaxis protein
VFTKPVSPRLLKKALSLLTGIESPERMPDVPAEMASRHPLRILLAEDNTSNQKLATLMLARLGYRAEVVSNGHEAIAALRARPYDVVLMDVQMPDMDGLEATHLLRETLPRESQPVVIALTAHASKEDRELCLESGMDDYLTKPLRPDLLVEALSRAATRRSNAA